MPSDPPAPDPARFAIVAARFNAAVVEGLVEGAQACFRRAGVGEEQLTVLRCPGAFELSQVAARLVELHLGPEQRRVPWTGIVALAAIVRGETPHFEHVCAEATRGLGEVARASGVAIGFGVLTCDDMAQARARSGGDRGNKGYEAAQAVLDLATLQAGLRAAPGTGSGPGAGAELAPEAR